MSVIYATIQLWIAFLQDLATEIFDNDLGARQ